MPRRGGRGQQTDNLSFSVVRTVLVRRCPFCLTVLWKKTLALSVCVPVLSLLSLNETEVGCWRRIFPGELALGRIREKMRDRARGIDERTSSRRDPSGRTLSLGVS